MGKSCVITITQSVTEPQQKASAPVMSKTAAKKAAHQAKMKELEELEAARLRSMSEFAKPSISAGFQATKVEDTHNLRSMFATPDFVNCVSLLPTFPYDKQGEWKARAEYFESKSHDLGVRLGTSVHLLQAQADQANKDRRVLEERLAVVQGENCRLASLLSCYIKKDREREDLEAKLALMIKKEQVDAQEKAGMQAVLDNMSDTLASYVKKIQDDSAKRRFNGGFFASYPSDGEGAF